MEESKSLLLNHIDQLHTTPMGVDRIGRNLLLPPNTDVVEHCRRKILHPNCQISRQGKNWYCEIEGIIITVNAFSYTIITAHRKKLK